MHKKLICVILSLLLLLGLGVSAAAESSEEPQQTLTIFSCQEFLTFAENCRLDSYSLGLSVVLETDIDLSNADFAGIPSFSGTFDGKGHTISGVLLTSDGSRQGLFRVTTPEATVQNLTVEGQIIPGGSGNEVGGIVGVNNGTIKNCVFNGTVSGSEVVGGIVGKNTVTGLVENTVAEGQISGDHKIGGIAGKNQGVIRDCVSSASVNAEARQNTVDLSDITLQTITDSEAANTVTDIGGIAGISSGVIRACENRGAVGYRHMGYNIGGISGTQSGYITGCKNLGIVHGRKEVGGIVGHMEPVTQIEYSEDTLQILRGQLDTMSGMTGRASANAQVNAGKVSREINKLKEQVETAKTAVDSILPSEGNSTFPDPDKVQAAYGVLSKTFNDMPNSLGRIVSSTETTINSLSRDLKAISGQMNVMGQTLNGAEENLGGTIADISDLDTSEDLTGKVEDSHNEAEVLADLNAGGIAGAMAMENDLDVLEDWERSGETSLNFSAELRAVILNSTNTGKVAADKQNAGGIVGWQSMGLVKDCISNCQVDSTNGENVGGISGLSTGYIRRCYAKGVLDAAKTAGGIAGSATVVTDSLAIVKTEGCAEQLGGILGTMQTPLTQTEEAVARNYYLPVEQDVGAVDGISYSGAAEPMEMEAFLSQDKLPEMFKTVTVSFRFADDSVRKLVIKSGTDFPQNLVPQLPLRRGIEGYWEGLDEEKLQNVMFDIQFQGVYEDHLTVISDTQTRNGKPLLLAEGTFTQNAIVAAQTASKSPALGESSVLLESWQIRLNEAGEKLRVLLPEGVEPGELSLYLQTEGNWEETPFKQDGSYAVFDFTQTEAIIAVVRTPVDPWPRLLLAAGVVIVVALLVILLYRRSRKTKK